VDDKNFIIRKSLTLLRSDLHQLSAGLRRLIFRQLRIIAYNLCGKLGAKGRQ
jgi:hypothetical protein